MRGLLVVCLGVLLTLAQATAAQTVSGGVKGGVNISNNPQAADAFEQDGADTGIKEERQP